MGIFVVIGSSISTTKDSLLNIIGSPVEFSLQIEIYRGLADPYLETAYKLACQLPYEEGFKFRICTVWNFLSTLNFIDKGDLYIEYVEK